MIVRQISKAIRIKRLNVEGTSLERDLDDGRSSDDDVVRKSLVGIGENDVLLAVKSLRNLN